LECQRCDRPADIPATKPDNDTDFKTIAELLTKSPGDTAVVLFHVEEGARSFRTTQAAQERYDNFVNFMKFVNKQRVRVLAIANMPYGTTRLGADYILPTEVLGALTDVTPDYAGFRPGDKSKSPVQPHVPRANRCSKPSCPGCGTSSSSPRKRTA
jgi:hypothetical protein